MADLHIYHEEAISEAKEAGEKLLALIEHTFKD
jgi:glycerol-3-phosphate cytidylyltransferase-like family protein